MNYSPDISKWKDLTKKQKDGSLCNIDQNDDDDDEMRESCVNCNDSMLQGKCFLFNKIKKI